MTIIGCNPGLEGVVAGATALSLVDGANGRLLYRGYRIGDLIECGTYAQVAELLWTGSWPASACLPPERVEVMTRAAKVEALKPCSAAAMK